MWTYRWTIHIPVSEPVNWTFICLPWTAYKRTVLAPAKYHLNVAFPTFIVCRKCQFKDRISYYHDRLQEIWHVCIRTHAMKFYNACFLMWSASRNLYIHPVTFGSLKWSIKCWILLCSMHEHKQFQGDNVATLAPVDLLQSKSSYTVKSGQLFWPKMDVISLSSKLILSLGAFFFQGNGLYKLTCVCMLLLLNFMHSFVRVSRFDGTVEWNGMVE